MVNTDFNIIFMKKVSGVVIRGKKEGKRIGYPTANIQLPYPIESGVYAGAAWIRGKKFSGAIFVGKDENILEIHVLDFEGDLYGQEIEVEIGEKIREIHPFESEEKMRELIAQDVDKIRGNRV